MFVSAGIVLVGVDAALWISAAKASGDAQKAWITAGATVTGAVVAVAGTVLGANLAATLALGSAQKADRRATYAQLMGAVAAYIDGHQQHQALQADAEAKKLACEKLQKNDPGYAVAVAAAREFADASARAGSQMPRLSADVRIAAAATRLLGPSAAAEAAEQLQKRVLTGRWDEAAVTEQVTATYKTLSDLVQ
ncbi:hypothetical protein [Nocardia macrotermitis]|uniref:Uncharacterized protein n=1 Tax=Nocardia macrotermitis TaxID=2585198 RepID=A0A7K0DF84_9NOCA|nr:hypothetical protein [Nocardia macrotermitis]MQY24357.1 hypothetical protein [Nocardia macrotermitis]